MADAVSVAPHIYSVLLENDRVRVLAIRTEPGAGSETHSHPDMVLYAATDCDWSLTGPDGEVVEAKIPPARSCSLTRRRTPPRTLAPTAPTPSPSN